MLGEGRVRDVAVESSRQTLLSRIVRLRLGYEGAADAPGSLILKSGIPGRGSREVDFYAQVAAVTADRIAPRCFEAASDRDSKTWHVLLEDLTDSHDIATVWPLPPTAVQCEQILRTLARLHAVWWDDARLGISVGAWLDTAVTDANVQGFAAQFGRFADRLGDRLSRERRDLYERFIEAAPGLYARYHARRNLSVAHGDAHFWNCFMPRDGGDDVRLFDWDNWRVGVPSNDLAYMIAMSWYPDRRRRLERPLLDHYHAVLVAHGVRGYDRRTLDDDYRRSVLMELMKPVWQAADNLPPLIWWGNLERIVLAVDDLGCRELLS